MCWTPHEEMIAGVASTLSPPLAPSLMTDIAMSCDITGDGSPFPLVAEELAAIQLNSPGSSDEPALPAPLVVDPSALPPVSVVVEPEPTALPAPFVVEPAGRHRATLLFLHGFTCSGKQTAQNWMPAIAEKLGPRLSGLRLVFLNAPKRHVSCYGEERPRLRVNRIRERRS